MTKTAAAMSNWWLAASSQQCACSRIRSPAEFLAKHQITQVTQPRYRPDWVPCDFWFFPKLKSPLKVEISDHQWTQENTKGQLMAIPTKDFAECFEPWKRCWGDCVRSQGAYFEGDWDIIVLCTMFLVSCIFNKCLHFSYYIDRYFLDRLHTTSSHPQEFYKWL